MSIRRREIPHEEVLSIGLRTALVVHLCGCLYVLAWVALRTQSFLPVLGVLVQSCVSVAVPLIVAGGVTELVEFLRRYLRLPIPLFTRVCVVLIESAFFGWIIVLIGSFVR